MIFQIETQSSLPWGDVDSIDTKIVTSNSPVAWRELKKLARDYNKILLTYWTNDGEIKSSYLIDVSNKTISLQMGIEIPTISLEMGIEIPTISLEISYELGFIPKPG